MIGDDLKDLMMIPGVSGYEDNVRRAIEDKLSTETQTDVMGNLWVTYPGQGPSVMVFAHMDQLGLIVRKIDADGFLRVHRLGGVPERALPMQPVVVGTRNVPGVIAMKAHHATLPEEKYQVSKATDLYIDCGFSSAQAAQEAGIKVGAPVAYAPHVSQLHGDRITGTSVDDRAGCAVLIDLARRLAAKPVPPTVHLCFTTQEEFNLRGAQPLAQRLQPDIAIQLDLMLATDTPDMADVGDLSLGGGPGMSLYSFHGRGTLNGVIPHPALVACAETAAAAQGINLQRSAQVGVLTDLSYVQLVGRGVAALDLGFPMRYSHGASEMCDVRDLHQLCDLLFGMLTQMDGGFSLERDA